MWIELRDDAPDDFAAAVQFDRAMRSMTPAADSRRAFVHKSLQPLDEVDFQARKKLPLFDSFTEECEGMCGV